MKINHKACLKLGILLLFICGFIDISTAQSDTIKAEQSKIKSMMSSFRDTTDGAIDMSSFLLDHHGVMPVPFIITEPAVGYGGGFALLYFHKHKKKTKTYVPPHISGIAGLGTQNGTWFAGAFHFHVFGDDKVRTITGFGKPYINIKYYGNNSDFLSKNPIKLNMNAFAAIQRVQFRVAESDLFVGGSYVLFNTNNSLDTIPGRPLINKILSKINGQSTISMLQPIINWDSRDNIFTPYKGMNTGMSLDYNATWLGADENFYKLNTYFFGYQPISDKIFSGWRFDGSYMLGDAPAYALPFINLRGVPAMRYQSDNTMLVETEWRFKTSKRWAIDVFTGTGKAFTSFSEFGKPIWVYNYGAGFRYELAKAFGMSAGVDFAFSNNGDFAFYLIFGSAWNK